MKPGRVQLRDWLTRQGLRQKDLARLLQVDEAFISQLLSAARSPGLGSAVQIARVTGIPVVAWVPSRMDKTKKRSRRPRPEVAA